jgi:hypothetical protein
VGTLEGLAFWAALWNTGPAEDDVFESGTGSHANLTRQWAELAYWFPAASRAAGRGPVMGATNHDFTLYSMPPVGTPFSVESHGYMTAKKLPEVWGAFEQVRDILKR